jgi:hypothetical protein
MHTRVSVVNMTTHMRMRAYARYAGVLAGGCARGAGACVPRGETRSPLKSPDRIYVSNHKYIKQAPFRSFLTRTASNGIIVL